MRKNSLDKGILLWLYTGAVLISLMVIIGGITRLTQSGLSMVDWNLVMGSIPPTTEAEWINSFEDYKQFPEFQEINQSMTLGEFKKIFFWEYIHRLLGRVIGIVFLIPFLYFLAKGRFSPRLLRQSIFLLFLGALHGFLGWYMVKSGLTGNPHVSHYRLAMHLTTAFGTYAFILWVIYGIKHPKKSYRKTGRIQLLLKWFFGLLSVQIVYGAFVAGLKAGKIFSFWPKMGSRWIAEDVGNSWTQSGISSLIDNGSSVQFIHRYIAIALFILVIWIWIKSRRVQLNMLQVNAINALVVAVLLQFTLGVFTLIYQVPIALGVLHQFGALITLTATIYSLYHFRK